MNRIYIAGPMKGIKDHNFQEFFDAQHVLEKLGYTVINPAELAMALDTKATRDAPLTCERLRQLINRCLTMIHNELNPKTDYLVLLHGWESSKGAKAEAFVAAWLGVPVVLYEDFIHGKRNEVELTK